MTTPQVESGKQRNSQSTALKAHFTFRTNSLEEPVELNRAFSADHRGKRVPVAPVRAKANVAPSALNAQ
jgi:hypothetical protein